MLCCALLAVVIVPVPITQTEQPLPAGYGHLVVATSTQCCIYSLSSLNTPTIVDIKDTVTLLLLSERQARASAALSRCSCSLKRKLAIPSRCWVVVLHASHAAPLCCRGFLLMDPTSGIQILTYSGRPICSPKFPGQPYHFE